VARCPARHRGYRPEPSGSRKPRLPDLQVDALTAAGCYRVFTETASDWAGRSGTSSTPSPAWPTAASGSAASRRRSTPPPRDMYASKQDTVAAIARTLGVSRASIYRNLAEPRS
jgi:hypothetical protein